jgi:hypothetical protein
LQGKFKWQSLPFEGDLNEAPGAKMSKSAVRTALKGPEKPLGIGRASLRGVEVVTIPLAEYSSLLADHEELARIVARRPKGLPRSPIDRNPDLKAFIEERLGKMEISAVAAACAAQFGKKAPSRSAIHRFLHRRNSL